ncbi:MAG: hypothetical protein QXS04_05240 [Thermoproteota archaeon]
MGKRTLILAKTILSSTVYLASLLVLLTITMLRAPGLVSVFALFGGVFTFSVTAAIIFEIILLSRILGKQSRLETCI